MATCETSNWCNHSVVVQWTPSCQIKLICLRKKPWMQFGGGVPNQVRGCHPCECLAYSPTTCSHGLVPKSPQLSRQVIQVLLGVGSRRQNFCLPSVQNKTNLSDTNTSNISMPWFHRSHVLAASTGQSTTPSWLLCMFSFENYADQSLGLPPEVDWNAAWNDVFHLWNERAKNFISNARTNTWTYITCKNYRNLARHVGRFTCTSRGFNVCCHGILLVLVHDTRPESKLQAYFRYANLGTWREAALDDVIWNSHLGACVNSCRM